MASTSDNEDGSDSPITSHYNCCLCEHIDTRSNLIQCNTCAKLAHHSCALVEAGTSAQSDEWICKFCIKQRQALNAHVAQHIAASNADMHDNFTQQMEALEKNITVKITDMLKELIGNLAQTKSTIDTDATANQKNPANERIEDTADNIQDRPNAAATAQQLPGNSSTPITTREQNDNNRRNTIGNTFNLSGSNRDYRNLLPTSTALQTSILQQTTDSLTNLLTRQTLQELPEFNGDARQWPRFKAVYQQTSAAGNFSDLDNLSRLERALKGKARDTVESLLFDPNNVKDIMLQLEEIHGRPEIVINELLHELRKQKPPREGPPKSLIPFSQKLNSLVANIKALRKPMYLHNPMEVANIVSKLPNALQIKWAEKRLTTPGEATLSDLNEWMLHQARLVSLLPNTGKFEPIRTQREHTNVHIEKPNKTKCGCCSRMGHKTAECRHFLDLSVNKRWKKIKANKLCLSCLNEQRHSSKDCPEAKTCNINGCTYRHHKLLHGDSKPAGSESKITSTDKSDATFEDVGVNIESAVTERPLFKIIPVTLYGPNTQEDTFAFLDDGSSATLLDHDLAMKLKLTGQSDPLCIRWTKNVHKTDRDSIRTQVKIAGTNTGKIYQMKNVRTIRNLNLQCQSQDSALLRERYKHLADVPITTFKNARPQILIGLEHTHLLAPGEVRTGQQSDPVALHTKLGWTVQGKGKFHNTEDILSVCECKANDTSTNDLLRQFFSLESLGIRPQQDIDTIEEKRAREIIDKTMRKISANQYEIGLFWRQDNVKLCPSFAMALKRLEGVEHKMKKDPDLASWYREKFQEYISKQYIRKATKDDLAVQSSRTWYLPHFCVTNNNKQPPKRRLVFDAAAKVSDTSLNSMLLKGPDQNASMLTVLYQFRQYKVGVIADVKEMFSQIRIRPDDQQSQRILWRDGESHREPETYIMQAMTFGSTCSPSSAQAVKNHNAGLYQEQFPEAAAAIVNNMYVDDYLNSHKTIKAATQIAQQVIEINKTAGFLLRNFTSNSMEVLKQLDPECVSEKAVCLNLENGDNDEKVLGLWWCIATDNFYFRIDQKIVDTINTIPTKRQLIRAIMKMFDPLGLISHFTSRAKTIMQDTWKDGLAWDERLNNELFTKWSEWIADLEQLKQVSVPRCYDLNYDDETSIEIHTFVDASLSCYAAVSYFRFVRPNDTHVALVCSKAKVAPTKAVSVPRLELMAALLGARLSTHLKSEHTFKINQQYLWSDSKVVLSWIRSTSKKYKQFVAVRKSEINDLTAMRDWHHVPTKLNVADLATKWTPDRQVNDNTWFSGPAFLKFDESQWPKEDTNDKEIDNTEEVNYHTETTNVNEASFDGIDDTKFSSWRRLVRVTAYVLRFVAVIRLPGEEMLPYLTVFELRNAEKFLIRKIQFESFRNELQVLTNGGQIESKSAIYTLSPILIDGIVRINSRNQHSTALSFDTKHPIILPKNHHVTRLIVKFYHEKFLHMGQESVLSAIRQRYWIISARNVLKNIKRNCQYCKNRAAIPEPPEMGQLPSCRNSPTVKPFLHSGVDIFGPLMITVNRHHQKRYGVIFVCMATRAIHIELAVDLSADAFLVCLRNFTFRRGPCTDLYSDNGTNLVGANRLIAELSAEKGINWHFNPPGAPHFGGVWERLIQSVKKCISVTLQSSFPHEDVLRSVLIEAEFIVNSRPLTHIPVDVEDDEPLTPNHFLFGCAGNAPLALQSNGNDFKCERKHWKLAANISTGFWNKWLKEYLPEICRRTKWYNTVEPVKPGDIGLIVDENLPRNAWRKAKVIATHPGRDGITRTITVKTASGELKRPVAKFAKLDVRQS